MEDEEVEKLNKMYENKELALKRMKFKMIEKRHNFAGKAFISFSTEDGIFFFVSIFLNSFRLTLNLFFNINFNSFLKEVCVNF